LSALTSPRRILLARTDRLGDVILSTPVATALKAAFPGVHLTFLVRRYAADIPRCHPDVDETLELDGSEIGGSAHQLARALAARRFDAAIALHPRPWLAWALWRARIPLRIGTGYRWYSFLFNRRVREHRKTAERHEAEYNLGLLRPLGISQAPVVFHFELPPEEEAAAARKLAALGVAQRPVVLHPSSGGSSREWPPERYGELAGLIASSGQAQVVLVGEAGEADLHRSIQERSGGLSLAGHLSVRELAVLLRRAAVLAGNSSGPLHLAVALGTPVVTFFPPIRACRPERWGPYGRREDVLMSQEEECYRCRRGRGAAARTCACMEAIPARAAWEKVKEHLTARSP